MIEPYGKTSLAELMDSIHSRARTSRITDVRNRNVDASLREASRNGAADIAGASGDEGGLSTKLHCTTSSQTIVGRGYWRVAYRRGEIAGFPAGLKKYRIGMKIAP